MFLNTLSFEALTVIGLLVGLVIIICIIIVLAIVFFWVAALAGAIFGGGTAIGNYFVSFKDNIIIDNIITTV